ncbi:phosphate ABC transporter permease subunit PstC [Halomicrococcus gelatinilyticus]|uniref:phosphate ABC transporter permease subunit PstC n=1 Tax=Halomicrococcus gelatinilyticus TaxID=1702103 RepID=UPI002E13D23D
MLSNVLQASGFGGFVENTDRRTKATSAVVVFAVLAMVTSFLASPGLLAFPTLLFFAAVAYGWVTDQETTAKLLMFLMTVSTILVLGLIIVYLISRALPVFELMGLDLVLKTDVAGASSSNPDLWDPTSDLYSLVPMIWGTLVTTFIAMLIAAPVGVAGAVFISEIAPPWAREILKPSVETLAGIPSIVYGLLGYTILNSYVFEEFQTPTFGSLFLVGTVIGAMALPTVVSVAEDAISSVPEPMKSGALALGATDWQTIKTVTIPASFSGISAAVLLGVGRAMGETMAATVIIGHSQKLPDPLYDVFGNTETLTTLIASQYGNATPTQLSALFAAGVVLFVTVLVLSVASQLIERRMKRKLGGKE